MKKVIMWVGMLAGIVLCGWMTVTSQNEGQSNLINYVCFALIAVIVSIAYIAGIHRAERITADLKRGICTLEKNQKDRGSLGNPNFRNKYLKMRYSAFKEGGSSEIRQYINLYDIENYTWRNIIEIVPDILTSIGILGTFVGLVIGLREFNPSDYEQISSTMTPLIEGIKVAFLTSIYGIAFAVPFSYGIQSAYGELEEKIEAFLELYDIQKEKEPTVYQEILSQQNQQTESLQNLAEAIAGEMVYQFEKVITPAVQKIGENFEKMTENQQTLVQGAAAEFASEFKKALLSGVTEFQDGLNRSIEIQDEYAKFIQITLESLKSALAESQEAMDEANRRSMRNIETLTQEITNAFQKEFSAFISCMNKAKEAQKAYAGVLDDSSKLFTDTYEKVQNAIDETAQKMQQQQTEGMQELEKVAHKCLDGIQKTADAFHDNIMEERQTNKEYLNALKEAEQCLGRNEQHVEIIVQEMQKIVEEMYEKVHSVEEIQGLAKTLRENEKKTMEYRESLLNSIKDLTQTMEANAEKYKVLPVTGTETGEQRVMQELLEELRELVNLEQRRQRWRFWERWRRKEV